MGLWTGGTGKQGDKFPGIGPSGQKEGLGGVKTPGPNQNWGGHQGPPIYAPILKGGGKNHGEQGGKTYNKSAVLKRDSKTKSERAEIPTIYGGRPQHRGRPHIPESGERNN